jgi:hypothetical protein
VWVKNQLKYSAKIIIKDNFVLYFYSRKPGVYFREFFKIQ